MGEQNNSDKGCSEGGNPPEALWVCTGCGGTIRDPVVLRVGPDQQWHTGCLRCAECQCPLEGSASCFLRDGRTLCRGDYTRIFAVKCGGCSLAVLPTDLVLKAGGHVYHPKCLRCSLCNRLLMPGDHFTLGPLGLSCQAEHTMPEPQNCTGAKPEWWKEAIAWSAKQDDHFSGAQGLLEGTVSRDRGRPGRGDACWDRPRGRGRGRGKAGGGGGGVRVRTILSDAQLRALRSCYSQTPRPDARVKLRLGQLTGLSSRVIRVWFQNKRCKDKRSSLGRGHGRGLSCTTLLYATARPMVVRTPEPPDHALQVYVYESPWEPQEGQL